MKKFIWLLIFLGIFLIPSAGIASINNTSPFPLSTLSKTATSTYNTNIKIIDRLGQFNPSIIFNINIIPANTAIWKIVCSDAEEPASTFTIFSSSNSSISTDTYLYCPGDVTYIPSGGTSGGINYINVLYTNYDTYLSQQTLNSQYNPIYVKETNPVTGSASSTSIYNGFTYGEIINSILIFLSFCVLFYSFLWFSLNGFKIKIKQ